MGAGDTTNQAVPDAPPDTGWVCNLCGQVIFRQHHILGRVRLWDLGEYQADAFLIAGVEDFSALRRYDTSLHQGWYCCRFMVMRMVVDKFGTGDRLMVYSDSVHPLSDTPAVNPVRHAAVQLGEADFDNVLASPPVATDLAVVKLGAIWCPPCRLMDAAIDMIQQGGGIEGVQFFDIDVDHEASLAATKKFDQDGDG
ncbi:MAG: hypothetical protein NVSMB32_17320 [Actinomycetota bacterium]